jgi:hypothetical protein
MNIQELITKQNALYAAADEAGAALKAYPKGALGLTLDSAKGPQWAADRAALDSAMRALQSFNVQNKAYLKDMSKARRSIAY